MVCCSRGICTRVFLSNGLTIGVLDCLNGMVGGEGLSPTAALHKVRCNALLLPMNVVTPSTPNVLVVKLDGHEVCSLLLVHYVVPSHILTLHVALSRGVINAAKKFLNFESGWLLRAATLS